MKLWYLSCGLSQEYAVVFAQNKEEAFEKLKTCRNIHETDIGYWDIEEFTEEKHNGVLYFY